MAITSTLTTSFKKELLEAVHNFKNSGGDTFKLALYTSSATLGAATTLTILAMGFLFALLALPKQEEARRVQTTLQEAITSLE